ncbi:MAG TPA: anhydro-N-acetylmuramic acid kinase [Anaerolineae bacterium]
MSRIPLQCSIGGVMIVLGLMSGSSGDGIDAAIVEIGGVPPELRWRLIRHVYMPFSRQLQDEIIACATASSGSVDRVCALSFELGERFADAALRAIKAAGLSPREVDLIGSHGQTVWHIPKQSTLQIGEPAVIAERTGIPTISNFRARDIAAGGHGAPLVAYVDVLLFTHAVRIRAMQNIGGIGNVTFLPPKGSPSNAFAFDTGPGNILIDQIVRWATNDELAFDANGTLASRGRIDEPLLGELLEHPYLKLPPPKSTGREMYDTNFADTVWQRALEKGLAAQDVVATVTGYTVESIAKAYREFLPAVPEEVIVSGGGAKNPTLLKMLRARLVGSHVTTTDEYGLPADAKEAVAFAILAYESAHNRPGNLSNATGATKSVTLGSITPGNAPDVVTSPESYSLTEANNPATRNIDELSTLEMVSRINKEDAIVAEAVAVELPKIAEAVEQIAERMRKGGRLIYVGAGTSGRLGVLDASEMPPTFGTSPDQVIGVIAGGDAAIRRSIEGAEDDLEQGMREIGGLNVSVRDSVLGLAASGRTLFVIGALMQAGALGALTVSLACNRPAPIQDHAAINITPLVGPEVIAGSTRMKAGTAEKMVLNLISTGVMIRLGKTFGNLMIDVQPTNSKLRDRAVHIVETVCSVSKDQAQDLLAQNDWQVKSAIVARLARVSPDTARELLARAGGSVRGALTIPD